jgi:hypothetical protein
MKRKLIYAAVIVAAGYAIFVGGYWAGMTGTEARLRVQQDYLQHINSLQAYSASADVAEAIGVQNSSRALCLASLHASAYATLVRSCLNSVQCRSTIEQDVQRIAPEFLSGTSLRVRYYQSGERCS